MIDADQADAAAGGWLLAQVAAGRLAAGDAAALTMVALDGKVLKGAWEELPDAKVKLFSALVHVDRENIGQVFDRGGDYILTVKATCPH
jgi:hypothetical protein